jgi:poly(3-hydroxybutyrate) depolymerase
MLSYQKLKSAFRRGFYGTSESGGACAVATRRPSRGPKACADLIAAPSWRAPGKRPLVVAIHGADASARQVMGLPMPGAGAMPQVALSALLIGCTADPLLPYHGGRYFYTFGRMGKLSSIEDSAKLWRELARLPDTPAIPGIACLNAWDRTRATRTMWGDAPERLQVGLITIEHGGHAEPSCLKRYPSFINRLVGAQNADFEVAKAAWEFFEHKRGCVGPDFGEAIAAGDMLADPT